MDNSTTKEIKDILNIILSSEIVLYFKTFSYHWNITSKNFSSHHKMLEKQYKELNEIIDQIAEMIRKYGIPVNGSASEFIKQSFIKEKNYMFGNNYKEIFIELVVDHEIMIKNMRKYIDELEKKDKIASDFLIDISKKHLEFAWFLRSHITN